MMKEGISQILENSKARGWVLEPDAKKIFAESGMAVPKFVCVKNSEEARDFASRLGYPVVAKVVSSRIVHKSDVGGVVINIKDKEGIDAAFTRLSVLDGFEGMLVEESVPGTELIVGASIDYQFGPVILVGLGGTAVEIYKDTALRLAPLKEKDAISMVKQLKAYPLLEGYRGAQPINMKKLTRLLIHFSELVMDMEELIESIDLNPVMCTGKRCVVADARIMLAKN